MILGITDDGNFDAEALGGGSLGNCFRCVVRSFGVNVGAEIFEEGFDAWLAEDDYVIDGTERGDELRASDLIEDGAAGPLEVADARVRIDADDENVSFAAGSFQIANVADVERVKAAVGKNDALRVLFVFR